MDVKELYDYVLHQSQAVAVQVEPEQLKLPTPDSEWNVRELMQHVMEELVWIPDIMAGRTMTEVGDAHEGDLLGDDYVANWLKAVKDAGEVVRQADLDATAHLSYTDKIVRDYLLDSADDILIHTWDLGQAIGVPVIFDERVASLLYDHMSKQHHDLNGSGLFGSEVTVPKTAGLQTRLLGLLGRSEDWAEARA
jgi:uncharacterized protein (TIGR03086 family)